MNAILFLKNSNDSLEDVSIKVTQGESQFCLEIAEQIGVYAKTTRSEDFKWIYKNEYVQVFMNQSQLELLRDAVLAALSASAAQEIAK